jgi:hypothetical protein
MANLQELRRIVEQFTKDTTKRFESNERTCELRMGELQRTVEVHEATIALLNSKVEALELKLNIVRDRVSASERDKDCMAQPSLGAAAPPRKVDDNPRSAILAQIRSRAQVLGFVDSLYNDIQPAALGAAARSFFFAEKCSTLEAVVGAVESHPACPDIVLLSCLINTIDNISKVDVADDERLAMFKSVFVRVIEAIAGKWPSAKILVEVPNPIIAADLTVRPNSRWFDGFAYPDDVVVLRVDYSRFKQGDKFVGAYRDPKHLNDTATEHKASEVAKFLRTLCCDRLPHVPVDLFKRLRALPSPQHTGQAAAPAPSPLVNPWFAATTPKFWSDSGFRYGPPPQHPVFSVPPQAQAGPNVHWPPRSRDDDRLGRMMERILSVLDAREQDREFPVLKRTVAPQTRGDASSFLRKRV